MEEIFLFVNPKSGGNKGQVFLTAPQPFNVDVGGRTVNLNIYSQLEGKSGDKEGYKHLKKVIQQSGGKPIRAVVGGGDGTVMWFDCEATKHGIDTSKDVIIGIMPLGTGNDFSRVAGWGGKNPQDVDRDDFQVIKDLVVQWAHAQGRPHDVWEVTLNVSEAHGELRQMGQAVGYTPGLEKSEKVLEEKSKSLDMINYFSIGQDSQVGMHFDKHRTKSQSCNLFVYACSGLTQELECWNQQHVTDFVANLYEGVDTSGTCVMESDQDHDGPELLGNPQSLMFLNVDSFAGGNAHFWQKDTAIGVEPPPEASKIDVIQDPGDGKLEVVALPDVLNIASDKIMHMAKRIYSGGPYYIQYYEDEEEDIHVFCQVDGEFYHMVNPESTTVTRKKVIQVLQRVADEESEDEGGHFVGC
eukprot:TRINITY_DN2511_c4_g1_i1.p1 TRINITY_DN2511_c4_g1~~TRINITY_DN2511_c4_g1_i1.p1  ORF type:complete len:412 (-),score=85.11 TRINITY_DN2511_c4_g1_i1:96-1331(-)